MAKPEKKPANETANPAPAPAPAVAPPAPAPTEAAKRTRSGLSEEARKRGAVLREIRTSVNEYLTKIAKRSTADAGASPATSGSEKRAEKIADLEAQLAKGTRTRPAPIFGRDEGGKAVRVGTQYVEKNLLPLERADLVRELDRLRGVGTKRGPGKVEDLSELRGRVLAALPDFAKHNGYDRATLSLIGFPEADLAEAFPVAPSAPAQG